MDGMAQAHCSVPWEANYHTFGKPLKQHLQGMLEHHKIFVSLTYSFASYLTLVGEQVIYRTFHNLKNDSNLAIQVLLLQLQRYYDKHKCFPLIIYWQVDGGSENSNQYVLAVCELLVALRIVKEIHLTRLPVGHTHEDIDAR